MVWLTGLSGSGKSTLAFAVERHWVSAGHLAYVLDGDNGRHGLSADLGFSAAVRTEKIRRIGEVAALFAEAGVIVVVAFISPFEADRARARGEVVQRRSCSGLNGQTDEELRAAGFGRCETNSAAEVTLAEELHAERAQAPSASGLGAERPLEHLKGDTRLDRLRVPYAQLTAARRVRRR